MLRVASILVRILHEIPRTTFEPLVGKHRAERGAKGFSCWTQLVAMVFSHLVSLDTWLAPTRCARSATDWPRRARPWSHQFGFSSSGVNVGSIAPAHWPEGGAGPGRRPPACAVSRRAPSGRRTARDADDRHWGARTET